MSQTTETIVAKLVEESGGAVVALVLARVLRQRARHALKEDGKLFLQAAAKLEEAGEILAFVPDLEPEPYLDLDALQRGEGDQGDDDDQ